MKNISFNNILKKTTLTLILFIFFPLTSFGMAVKGGDSLTTSGFSGIINVATADTISNGMAVSVGLSTDFKDTTLLPRFGFGFLDMLEVGGAVDLPFNDMGYTGGTVGLKVKVWSNPQFSFAISGNLQFNGYPKGTNIDGQILAHATWKVNPDLITTAVFGKTFGQTANTFTNWDFGMGVEWWMVNNSTFELALAVDISNYDYRASLSHIPAEGAYKRGNVSGIVRFGFIDKILMFDIGATNLLDTGIALYTSLASSFNF